MQLNLPIDHSDNLRMASDRETVEAQARAGQPELVRIVRRRVHLRDRVIAARTRASAATRFDASAEVLASADVIASTDLQVQADSSGEARSKRGGSWVAAAGVTRSGSRRAFGRNSGLASGGRCCRNPAAFGEHVDVREAVFEVEGKVKGRGGGRERALVEMRSEATRYATINRSLRSPLLTSPT